ncbi:hypothetical protein Tco_0142913, partial [Tanacetum coccineum]
SYEEPLLEGNTSGSVEASMQLRELMVLVPTLKVKSLETTLKRKSYKVIISELEDEEPEDQGRIIQDIDDDPLISLVRESMKSTDFVTPTKASGGAQEEDINPTILEAAKTLSKVTSQGVSNSRVFDSFLAQLYFEYDSWLLILLIEVQFITTARSRIYG